MKHQIEQSTLTKIFLSLVFGLAISGTITSSASAWVGSGTGGTGGGGGGGGGGGCTSSMYGYTLDCAGVSWAFYEAKGQTSDWTDFPYFNSSWNVSGVSIPPSCSEHSGAGFWHYGINLFDTNLGMYDFNSSVYGHWVTMNANNTPNWAPYKTSGIWGNRQWVGVYQLSHYGSWNDALKAYQDAYLYDHPDATSKPTSIPGDVWGFCWGPHMQDVTLTIKSIDSNGNSLSHLMADKTAKGRPGTNHSATVGNIPGYNKKFWGTNTDSSTWWASTDMTYSENISTNKTIYAVYEQNIFEGQSTLSGAASATAGYTRTSDSKSGSIANCSPVSGCKVSFNHNLKRITGSESTTYTITRTANMLTSSRKISPTGTIKTGTSGNPNGETVSSSGEWTLYPGMVVCERMTFKANTLPDTTESSYTQVCAFAFGNAQPGDPTGSNALLDMNVKNDDVSAYNSYRKEIYAKPGDKLTYQASYHPWLQYTYYLTPQKLRINGGTIYPTSGINTSNYLYSMYNTYKGSLRSWNNSFSVSSANFLTNVFFNYCNNSSCANSNKAPYSLGDFSQKLETNPHTVETSEVGKSLDETAQTNLNTTTQTTPSQVAFTNSSGNNLGDVITTPLDSTASAFVPYNFINTTKVTTSDSSATFYAGETATISYNYIINPTTNSLTSPSRAYATTVGNPQWRLKICVGQSACNANNYTYETPIETKSTQDFTVPVSKMYTGRVNDDAIKLTTTINIPDVAAGTRVCVKSSVFPATSGAPSNYNNPNGNGAWQDSTPVCFDVAKKPSLQVWGGNVYTQGSISTTTSTKNNLAGYHTYDTKNKRGTFVFGSWGENGIIASGAVSGFSSGASLGYTANNNGTLTPNPFNNINNNTPLASSPGGSNQISICNRSPLTFANKPCTGSAVGMLGNSIAIGEANTDKTALINKFLYGGETSNTSGAVSLNDTNKERDKGVYYYYGTGSLTIDTSTIIPSTIQIVHSDSDIDIIGDVTYDSASTYSSLSHLPKLVVYAKNNINIHCNVKQIDAILIAETTITTCSDSTDINSQANSNQLLINGAVITSKLVPNRTYGAATGANSIVPAEIINFDPSLYLWGGSDTTASEGVNTNLDTSHLKELPPRY